ncbi:outer membrane protein assembly factor BamA [Bartonella sp. DGB2]|uniref:outer membrane protein assembly factor BamA n=1 Tax=Bartonella sp. DGB2 TaxID=3388426 RepID=UPI00398FFA0F
MMTNSKFLGAVSVISMHVATAMPAAIVAVGIVPMIACATTVSSIVVRGNHWVNGQMIRDTVGIEAGQNFSQVDLDEATKRLFAKGLFSEVKIAPIGSNLVISVREYKTVDKVFFQGNSVVKDEQLAKILSLKAGGPFNQRDLQSDAALIREAYRSVGRNDVVVQTQTADVGNGRVNVLYKIEEGKRSKILNVHFSGNHIFGQHRLSDVISTKKTGLLSWLTRSDVYTPERLAADKETLTKFYNNRGYPDFQIVSTNVDFDAQKDAYAINFVIDEGAQYKFGDMRVESIIDGLDPKVLQSVIKSKKGDIYNATFIDETVLALTTKMAELGYVFTKVEPRVNHNFANHTISIAYYVEPGPRAYVQRIEVQGNEITRDYVVRRELDINEGDAYNQVFLNRAKQRLESLDYFQKVDISVKEGSEPDQVILVVNVVEKQTGELYLTGGYSTGGETPGLSTEGAISQRNLFGRGQSLRISAGAGQGHARNLGISFTEPYFLGYRMSLGFDLAGSSLHVDDTGIKRGEKDPNDETVLDKGYGVRRLGGSVRLGLPLGDNLSASLVYSYNREAYTLDAMGEDAKDSYSQAILDAADNSPWVRSSIILGLTYSTIDNLNNPHSGSFGRITQEYAGLAGDAHYWKGIAKLTTYKTLSERLDIVGLVALRGGHIQPLKEGGARIFDMFKSDNDIIRGFQYNGIGPYQQTGLGGLSFLGGTSYLSGTIEAQFPIPVLPEALGVRGALFADTATLFGSSYDSKNGDAEAYGTGIALRASVGASLLWASPFGPLRVDYAIPVVKQEQDIVKNFSFGVSTKF